MSPQELHELAADHARNNKWVDQHAGERFISQESFKDGYNSRDEEVKQSRAALNNVLELAIANESIVLNGIVHQQALRALEIND